MKAIVDTSINIELDKDDAYTPEDTEKIVAKQKELSVGMKHELEKYIENLLDNDTDDAFERGRIT